jgi:hypothetical protein
MYNWVSLNEALKNEFDEAKLWELLKAELDRPVARVRYALRIHSRLNRVRAAREREEILKCGG